MKVSLHGVDWTAQEKHSDEVAIIYLEIQDWKSESGALITFVKPIHIFKGGDLDVFSIDLEWTVSLKETTDKFVLSIFNNDEKITEIETKNIFDSSPINNTYSC